MLTNRALELSNDGGKLTYTYDPHKSDTGISALLQAISEAGLQLKDLQTTQSTLEDIFVSLVKANEPLINSSCRRKPASNALKDMGSGIRRNDES
ncbi:MAG TPA: hypothetical protein ENI74_07075 [Gammaproteobacteria bacterium]|nr:hypothetical protein [Gammaproteobacteria bacterium]